MRDLADGQRVLSPAVAPAVYDALRRGDAGAGEARRGDHGPDALTEREREVMGLIARGRPNREIAESLFISPRTAQGHVARIFAKLGVNSRSAAVAAAFEAGLVPDRPGRP